MYGYIEYRGVEEEKKEGTGHITIHYVINVAN